MARHDRRDHVPGIGDVEPEDDASAMAAFSLDSTLPPTPLKQLLVADGASVFVLSHDAALTETIDTAGGEQYPVHVVEDWAGLVALVEQRRCRIALLDVEALPGDIERCLDELAELDPHLVVLVAAERDAAQPLISLLSARRIHRLLIKPATVGVTRLLFESAVNRYLQLRDAVPDPFDTPAEGLTRRPQTRQRKRRTASVAGVAAALLVAGLGLATALGPDGFEAWRRLGGWIPGGPGAETGIAGAARDAPAAAARTTTSDADAPAANDAATPAANDADTSAADDGAVPAASNPDARAADAARPAAGGAAAPDAGDVAAPAAEPEPAPDPHAARLEQARAALEAGRLAAPPGDNALAHYEAVLAQAPEHAEATQGLALVLDRLYGRAERELVAGNLDVVDATLERIRGVQSGAARLTILDAQLRAARESAAEERAASVPASDTDDAAGDAAAAPAQPPPGPAGAGSADADGAQARGAADPSAAGEPPGRAAPARSAEPSEYDSLLAIAGARIEQGRLVEPAGDSALDYVERAAARGGDDPRLVDVRGRLAAAVAAEARILISAGRLTEASELVDLAFELGLEPEAQTQLDLELSAAREQALRRQAAEWLALARARIREGALTTPEDDSARYYLDRLATEQPGIEGLDAARSAFVDALLERAGQAVTAGDWQRAETALAALGRTDADPARLAALRERLDHARRQAEYLSTPASAAEMTLIEAGSVAYPEEAREEDVEGWVDVEFVVDETGAPADPRVVAAEPLGYFEAAALESVLGSRYEPFEAGGEVYARLVRVRVRFGLR